MGDGLAGDISLNLSLVDPIDTAPDECPADAYSPKSVSPQWVHVKAGVTGERGQFKIQLKAKNYHKY